ncbi:MAG: hypothetical protein Q9163_002674 [Psora crenata]
MAPVELTCRIRVEQANDSEADSSQLEKPSAMALKGCPDVDLETRLQWEREVRELFGATHDHIRPWDILAKPDGSIELLSTESTAVGGLYPARFQIPSSCLRGLGHGQRIKRTEMFAMASLLYEMMTGRQPFEELTDDEVQQRFSEGDFPDDAASLPNSLYIYSGWSEEFSQELTKRVDNRDITLLQSVGSYAKAHPFLTGIQIVGLTLSAASIWAVPILGAVGFTASGPAAGSLAAGWQASMGAVKAGSLFSWCQSAAMGGSALGGIQAVGAAGAALIRMRDVPELAEIFKKVFRNPNQLPRA